MAAKTVLDEQAEQLEALVKSFEPEKKESETLAESLVKSASDMKDMPEEEEDEEPMEESHAASTAETMRKSLDDSESYQQVVDVAEPLGVLGDAMVKGFTGLEKSQGALDARLGRLEKNLGLLMRAQAAILTQLDDRKSVRKPAPGYFGNVNGNGLQKSQGEQKVPFSAAQLERAATILIEEGKLPTGSGARLNVMGAENLYKSFDPPLQAQFAKVIEEHNI